MVHPDIKAVVFDLDGVYFEHGTERFIASLQKYGLSEAQIKDVYLKSPQMAAYKAGQMTDREFWQFAIDAWKIPTTQEELTRLLLAGYEESPAVVSLVDALRAQGIKTAVCTNNFPARLEELEKKFGLKKRFDVIVSSYEEGVLKPDAEIFNILAHKLSLQPSQIVMSDDREANVHALQQLGFQSFLYQGFDDFKRRIGA